MNKILKFAALPVLKDACQSESPADKAAVNITKESLIDPIEKIASDEFEGRSNRV